MFEHVGRTREGRRWLGSLPATVAELERRWGVRALRPYRRGSAAWVAPAVLGDGTPAVLKVSWPHREAREEATALRFWDGDGAVRLYEADRARSALLLERCAPGTPLGSSGLPVPEMLGRAADVLRRLWRPPTPSGPTMERVADVTGEWASLLRERMDRDRPPFDPGLVGIGAELLETLPRTASREVVVHGDFNPGNILAARRHRWLAIDAKPMIGDPGYDPWPLLCQVDPPFARPDPGAVLAQRYQLFGALVGEPPDRLLAWSVARAVESALWHVAGGRVEHGLVDMAEAAVLARLLGP